MAVSHANDAKDPMKYVESVHEPFEMQLRPHTSPDVKIIGNASQPSTVEADAAQATQTAEAAASSLVAPST